MKILFIWNYHYFPYEKGKSRFSDLLNAFCKAGNGVEVICSSFYHMGKLFRDENDSRLNELPYKVNFVSELGYKRNVSFRRYRSIKSFNSGVENLLQTYPPVDIVYVPIPSNELGIIAENFAKRVGAKCIIDIEDLWPESFRMLLPSRLLYKMLFGHAEKRRALVFQNADAAVSVSQTYMDIFLKNAKQNTPRVVAPIGADTEYVQSLKASHVQRKPNGEFWIGYIGTLSKSYDLYSIIDSLDSLWDANQHQFVLKIMADGPDLSKVQEYASKKRARVDFLGLLPYEQMCDVLFDCDVGVNPIIGKSVSSLINKVADYAAVGLPVINTQQSEEYQKMLDSYQAGINCSPRDIIGIQKAIMFIYRHFDWLHNAQRASVEMSRERLNRKTSEDNILALVNSLEQQSK